MLVWAHDIWKVFILLEDLKKQKLAGLVYECRWSNDKLTLEIVKKGFWVGDLKDWSPSTICEQFTSLHELIELEKEEYARKSLRNLDYISTIVENLMIFYRLPTFWLTWKDAIWIIWVFKNYKNGYFHIILVVLENPFFNFTHVDVWKWLIHNVGGKSFECMYFNSHIWHWSSTKWETNIVFLSNGFCNKMTFFCIKSFVLFVQNNLFQDFSFFWAFVFSLQGFFHWSFSKSIMKDQILFYAYSFPCKIGTNMKEAILGNKDFPLPMPHKTSSFPADKFVYNNKIYLKP